MSLRIALPIRLVIMRYRSALSAGVTFGVTGVVIDVLLFCKLLVLATGAFVPVVRCIA